MPKPRYAERIVHRNQNGKIVEIKDTIWGGSIYILCNRKGKYVRDLQKPFDPEECLKEDIVIHML